MIETHDPGGKVMTRLPAGMAGEAMFSPCGKYRTVLLREWDSVIPTRNPVFALFIGLNPSTARADFNDPTITREIGFAKRLGFTRMVKVNVADYRATNPKDLERADVNPMSAANVQTIVDYAYRAEIIVAAWGAPSKRMAPLVNAITYELLERGLRLHCLGKTKDGHPRHPLYVRADQPLEQYA